MILTPTSLKRLPISTKWAAAVGGQPEPTAPTVPVMLSLADRSIHVGTFHFSWTVSAEENSPGFNYQLYGEVNGGGYTLLAERLAGTSTCTFVTFEFGVWTFFMRLMNDLGEGPDSNVIEAQLEELMAPSVAPVLTFNQFDDNIDMTWTASDIIDAAGYGYSVERNVTTWGAGWMEVQNVGAATLTASDYIFGLGAADPVLFRVVPYNPAGQGPPSNEFSVYATG